MMDRFGILAFGTAAFAGSAKGIALARTFLRQAPTSSR